MTTKRTPPKPWKPGESGNPKGRPRGSGFAGAARAALEGRLPEVLESVIRAALAGDMTAARIILERTVPALRPTEQPLTLGLPEVGATLTQQAADVLTAVARGEVAPGQGVQLIAAIGALAKVREVDELTARIERLEAENGNT